jgi:hypothetical protein
MAENRNYTGPVTDAGFGAFYGKQIGNAVAVKNSASSSKESAPKISKGSYILTNFLSAQNQFKIFHWQTTSFSQHKAFGEIYESLSEHIDEFIEVYMGKYGRIIAGKTFDISLGNIVDNPSEYVDRVIRFMVEAIPASVDAKDTDLLNIRDEMLGDLNQLKYLLTLK